MWRVCGRIHPGWAVRGVPYVVRHAFPTTCTGLCADGDPASPHTPQPGPRTHALMWKSDPRPQHASPDRLSRGTGRVCRGPDLGTCTLHHAPMSWSPRPRSRRPRTPRTGTRPLDTGLRASAHPTVQARYRFPDHCPEPRGPGPRTMAIAPEITHAPAPSNIPSHTRRRPADPIPLTPILPRSRCGSPRPVQLTRVPVPCVRADAVSVPVDHCGPKDSSSHIFKRLGNIRGIPPAHVLSVPYSSRTVPPGLGNRRNESAPNALGRRQPSRKSRGATDTPPGPQHSNIGDI